MNQMIAIGSGALLVGVAAGFWMGKAGSGEAVADGPSVETVAKVRRDGVALSSMGSPSGSGSKRSFADIMRDPGQTARLQGLIDLYADMDPAQLELEAAKLDALPMGDRIMASILLFSRWGEVDPIGAMGHADSMGFAGRFVKPTVLRSWASVDPVNAAKYYSENPGDFMSMGRGRGPRDGGAEIIAREWAKVDSTAALDWAKGLSGNARGEAMVSVIGQVAASDPAQAAAMATGLEGGDQSRAYGEIAEQWARTDFAAAEAWVATLDESLRDRAMRELLEVQVGDDPLAAVARIDTIQNERERDRAMETLAGNWSQDDPQAAATWLTTQETGDVGDAMRRVMGNWAAQDAAGALSFIESQPVGELRDGATQSYLWMNRSMEGDAAVALAESIQDERSRARSIGMTARRWMETDEPAARAYLESTDAIDDSLKQRLLGAESEER